MQADASDTQEFALRERSPRAAAHRPDHQRLVPTANNRLVFETTAQSLEIVRYAPEGDIPLAPQLSVTFSQPMIAISSQKRRPLTCL